MRQPFLALVAAFGIAAASSASADVVMTTIAGNDCPGVFGKPFEVCVAPNGSPSIIKYEFDDDGDITGFQVNTSLFPTVDGSEFTIDVSAGTWSYLLGVGDPAVTAWSAKGGPVGFNLFVSGVPVTSGSFAPPAGHGLSHLVFYDTRIVPPPPPPTDPIPEPASLALLGIGLAGLGVVARRRRRAG